MCQQTYIDQLSRGVQIKFPPRRIISIVPSQTELLFDLDLDDEIIGVTKFCIHPADKVKGKTKIGGTKNLDLHLIRSLKPDLIIGNKEENEQRQIENLMYEFPVWMSDIFNLQDALSMINSIGEVVNRTNKAQYLLHHIGSNFEALPKADKPLRIAYLIWQKPFMVAGKNTFIDDMLQRCGFANAFDSIRYPEVTTEELQQAKPDVVMLSSEPYPFKQKHIDTFYAMLPKSQVILVDGEMFSWYGSRLLKAVAYFKELTDTLA